MNAIGNWTIFLPLTKPIWNRPHWELASFCLHLLFHYYYDLGHMTNHQRGAWHCKLHPTVCIIIQIANSGHSRFQIVCCIINRLKTPYIELLEGYALEKNYMCPNPPEQIDRRRVFSFPYAKTRRPPNENIGGWWNLTNPSLPVFGILCCFGDQCRFVNKNEGRFDRYERLVWKNDRLCIERHQWLW